MVPKQRLKILLFAILQNTVTSIIKINFLQKFPLSGNLLLDLLFLGGDPLKTILVKLFCSFILTLLMTQLSFANMAETFLINKVLKGNSFIGTNQSGMALYIFVAGVDCADRTDKNNFILATNYANKLINQQVFVRVTQQAGNRVLAEVNTSPNGGGQDFGSQLLQNGYCWYRNIDADQLDASLSSAYPLLQQMARTSRRGIWNNATGTAYFTTDPSSWRCLNLDQVNQQRVNGTPDPKNEDFNRPGAGVSYTQTDPCANTGQFGTNLSAANNQPLTNQTGNQAQPQQRQTISNSPYDSPYPQYAPSDWRTIRGGKTNQPVVNPLQQ